MVSIWMRKKSGIIKRQAGMIRRCVAFYYRYLKKTTLQGGGL